MRKLNIAHWKYSNDMDCLLLFASLMDEMTFSYSIDSYKESALNIVSLIRECISVVDDVKTEVVKKGALKSVIEELKWAIDNDPVAKEIITNRQTDSFINEINETITLDKLVQILEIYYCNLQHDYLPCLKQYISNLVKENKNKLKLEDASRILITQLKYIGYTNEYIAQKSREFFFNPANIVKGPDVIDDFLNIFDGDKCSFVVIHRGNGLFSVVQAVMKDMGCDVSNSLDIDSKDNAVIGFSKDFDSNKEWYVKIPLNALDAFAARNESIKIIEIVSNLLSFYHHKKTLSYNNTCLVKNEKTGEIIKVGKPIKGILKCKDLRVGSASFFFNKSIRALYMVEDSMDRLSRSLRLHRNAVLSENVENQFVDIFTAIEVLIPKKPDIGADRIVQIRETLLPYICLDYFCKLIDSVGQSLLKWNENLYNKTIASITEGNNDIEKLCAFFSLDKYDANRKDLYKEATNESFLLMRYRIFKLNRIMRSPKELYNFIEKHETRLRWHIDRIYRTRNIIVHTGFSPVYLETLVENIHSYYDILIKAIIADNSIANYKKLEHSYTTTRRRFKKYKEYLNSHKNDSLDENNFAKLILNK